MKRPAFRRPTQNAAIRFGANGGGRLNAGSSWDMGAEMDFTWTGGRAYDLDLVVPRLELGQEARLTIGAYPFLTNNPPVQTVEIRAGDTLLAIKTFEQGVGSSRGVPIPLNATGIHLKITLNQSEVRSLAELGASADPRHLELARSDSTGAP